MIRDFKANDKAGVMELSSAVGLFEARELSELANTVDQHFAAGDVSTDKWFVDDEDGIAGVAYAMPERMTEGTWNLLYIAIDPAKQRCGRGGKLLSFVERALAKQSARVLLVETAGLDDFEYVRSFYRSHGYREEARISDFYIDGMDKVVYWKRLD
ncbi:GNAT family N-acetyltransferase [Crateriforma conspicua]|uniref:GNAT family N-acetyltransferase n=1 Tax=Crateriforma conspicua TaxID=2527996 RepID=UPI0011880BF3|nr:GNAT family N-acetyltransferase [Crateriforma conspicua]QDV62628.1 hypothetical protein Mal65_17620 [Crateriforma conspicua]